MPVIYLDVDGTLLPFAPPSSSSAPGYLGRLDPALGPWLAALPAELVWATTWMAAANETLGRLLGLPPLEVLDPADPTPEDAWSGLHWKTRAIAEHAAGRPFAWLDDEITRNDREWVAQNHPQDTLLLRTDPRTALTPEDRTTVADWLAVAAG